MRGQHWATLRPFWGGQLPQIVAFQSSLTRKKGIKVLYPLIDRMRWESMFILQSVSSVCVIVYERKRQINMEGKTERAEISQGHWRSVPAIINNPVWLMERLLIKRAAQTAAEVSVWRAWQKAHSLWTHYSTYSGYLYQKKVYLYTSPQKKWTTLADTKASLQYKTLQILSIVRTVVNCQI